MNKQPLISISAQFPTDLARAARVEAARRNVSRAEFVRLAVFDYLKRSEAEQRNTGWIPEKLLESEGKANESTQ